MTKTKKMTIITVLLAVIIIITSLVITLPQILSSKLNIEINIPIGITNEIKNLETNSNSLKKVSQLNPMITVVCQEAKKSSFVYNNKESEPILNSVYKTESNFSNSLFCDDILISFKVLNGSEVKFFIGVTFYFNDWSGGTKGEEWTVTSNKGNRLMNSGKYGVYKVECNWTVTYNNVTTSASYTFTK